MIAAAGCGQVFGGFKRDDSAVAVDRWIEIYSFFRCSGDSAKSGKLCVTGAQRDEAQDRCAAQKEREYSTSMHWDLVSYGRRIV